MEFPPFSSIDLHDFFIVQIYGNILGVVSAMRLQGLTVSGLELIVFLQMHPGTHAV